MKFGTIGCVFQRFAGGRIVCKKIITFDGIAWQSKVRNFCSASRVGFDDYEKEISSWNITIPEKFNFASDVIDAWARKEREGLRDASIPALWFVSEGGQETKWNYEALEYETKRVANMLQEKCGIKRGDNVLVMLPKVPEFWLVTLATIRIGAVMSPSSMMLTTKDLSYRLSAFKPVCVIVHESVAELIDQANESARCSTLKTKIVVSGSNKTTEGWLDFQRLQDGVSADHKCAETRSDESMTVFFTSGTTGLPKMAEHSHSYSLAQLPTGRYYQDLTSDCIHWNHSDPGWAKTAYSGVFGPWNCGSCIFIHGMQRFNPSLTLQVLSKYPIDTFCTAPYGYRLMVRENLKEHKFPKLHHCISGGEALNPEIMKIWHNGTGLKIYEGYGQSETVLLLASYKCIDHRPGSLGKPVPGMDVVILDENENELGSGQIGEISIKKRQGKIVGIFKGYRNDPEKTKKTLTENYFHTGDMGYHDKDGYFWFSGRNDDVINSAGYRIGPFEVESALIEHPAVLEVAVISSPDEERGEVVKAFVVLKDTAQSEKSKSQLVEELQDHTKRMTAPYKYPRKIEFIEELPKTITGKVIRKALRDKEWNKS